MLGPKPPDNFKSDGCTWAPDFWKGIDLRPACFYHDWAYESKLISKWFADYYFYGNLRQLGMPIIPALFYWLGVTVGGGRRCK